jgi:hypothetical protein
MAPPSCAAATIATLAVVTTPIFRPWVVVDLDRIVGGTPTITLLAAKPVGPSPSCAAATIATLTVVTTPIFRPWVGVDLDPMRGTGTITLLAAKGLGPRVVDFDEFFAQHYRRVGRRLWSASRLPPLRPRRRSRCVVCVSMGKGYERLC